MQVKVSDVCYKEKKLIYTDSNLQKHYTYVSCTCSANLPVSKLTRLIVSDYSGFVEIED